ncbi:polynucleotide kinase-phosphatase [Dactylosporangium sp. AC04546]|uniref:polynucleotide kinase-phosphatase n=1 Tax=Dactylosporangium sp. AC04546 TaxID=2862460 RepID=UPI001EDD5092|nr:polynucleotide kinase-phosphatase [Dactylosporangium sp. AC04546]WVK83810.1 polynucleotide kinase-phosphatase [Dactylosporangium sp. AC04546]
MKIPELCLVALVGISGSGKSTFARRHFQPTQVLSSDAFRAMVADDENDQSASSDAFAALHFVAGKRLRAGRLTVVDATNVQAHARKALVDVARDHDVLPVAIVLDVLEEECWARTEARPDRDFARPVLTRQSRDLRRSLKQLKNEGFRHVLVLRGTAAVDAATIEYEKLYNDKRELTGPFDIIGDVHGCLDELVELLGRLGYAVGEDDAVHPEGRTAVFVGDLVDRGPAAPGVLRLVMGMVAAGHALCVAGNHEAKLLRKLRGANVRVAHGLQETLDQLAVSDVDPVPFLDSLIGHYVLDGGRLVVAHAGLKEAYHGRASGRVRAFALYGDTTGETDEYGLPVRYPWATEYRGKAMVVYGHTPVPAAEWVNNTICVDTGCVFGGSLTALRYPERELVSVPARQVYYEPVRPLAPPAPADSGLNLVDVTGRRTLGTPAGRVTVAAENAAAALEVMSRFAVDPRWLVWLPPTMAPATTSRQEGFLEHPVEALGDYAKADVPLVVCQEKHMGSRAVLVVCRSPSAALKRFGITGPGAIYTRTGRPFFPDDAELLDRVRVAAEGIFDELGSDWLVLDAEVLPWSAKAAPLIREQYASVAAAAGAALPAAVSVLSRAAGRGVAVEGLLSRFAARAADVTAYADVYRRYCWPTDGLHGVRLAAFHVLASEGANHARRDHDWHLALADRLVEADPSLFTPTRRLVVDPSSTDGVTAATEWWLDLTASGGEGMVVKPAADAGPSVQPAIKCRGREYLRIIYGPSYTERLDQLRARNLGRKRGLALREHGLGLAALDLLAGGAAPWRVHQLVFAVLACESEPVDPRL